MCQTALAVIPSIDAFPILLTCRKILPAQGVDREIALIDDHSLCSRLNQTGIEGS